MPGSTAKEIAAEFGFRDPQRRALMRLQATLDAVDLSDPLDDIKASLPGTIDFDTSFPSFCFDMATGVGKTKLLAGAVVLLARTGKSRNFFIIAPGGTIYEKLIRELTPGSPGYLFAGIGGLEDLRVITGDDYLFREALATTADPMTVYVFNIQKLLTGSEKQRYKFHTYQETLGKKFAERIRDKADLVVLMDESHRYRGVEYFAAIEALHPVLGLEFTATPAYRGNVIVDYPLKSAISDGWVKELRPIYRQNDASLEEELDDLKLKDGLLVHETTKLELATYAASTGLDPITPMVLINVQTIEEARILAERLESEDFGYAGRVLVIHSQSDDEEERRLVELESRGDVEIVVHVNRLREGWDVRNIFTIIPLRASVSTTLTAQTIGRGVRLPFGVNNRSELADPSVATLSVICYQAGKDNYKLIIDAAEQLGLMTPVDAAGLRQTERITVGLTGLESRISVPRIDTVIDATVKLATFSPQVRITEEGAKVRLIGVRLEGDPEDVGPATVSALTNPIAGIATSLLQRVPELSIRDAPAVARLVKDYLSLATGSEDPAAWDAFIGSKRKWMREDLIAQLRENLEKTATVKYTVRNEEITFVPFDTVLPVGSSVRSWRTVPDAEIRASLVGGYEKTVFEGFRFDSQQEKWLGDALEQDESVAEWLKVPEGQLAIGTPAGRYLPDFIALFGSVTYLVEVKRASEIEGRAAAVVEKARRAVEWCAAVSEATGREWRYVILRHDRVRRGDTFAGMVASAVDVAQFVTGPT